MFTFQVVWCSFRKASERPSLAEADLKSNRSLLRPWEYSAHWVAFPWYEKISPLQAKGIEGKERFHAWNAPTYRWTLGTSHEINESHFTFDIFVLIACHKDTPIAASLKPTDNSAGTRWCRSGSIWQRKKLWWRGTSTQNASKNEFLLLVVVFASSKMTIQVLIAQWMWREPSWAPGFLLFLGHHAPLPMSTPGVNWDDCVISIINQQTSKNFYGGFKANAIKWTSHFLTDCDSAWQEV